MVYFLTGLTVVSLGVVSFQQDQATGNEGARVGGPNLWCPFMTGTTVLLSQSPRHVDSCLNGVSLNSPLTLLLLTCRGYLDNGVS